MPQNDSQQILQEVHALLESFNNFRIEMTDRQARVEERLKTVVTKLDQQEKLESRIEALEKEKHEADGRRKVLIALATMAGGLAGGIITLITKLI